MYYDHRLLCERVYRGLRCNPNTSLKNISQELGVSRRTIQNVLIAVTGKKFRELQKETLFAKVQTILAARPDVTIKELASEVGYDSPRSLAAPKSQENPLRAKPEFFHLARAHADLA